jgi:RimJ/RimL family protein N-acetyltransferase
MFIRSERLFLRPGWSEDWSELLGRITDWAVVGQLMSMAETAKAHVVQAYTDVIDRRFPQFVVTLPSCDRLSRDLPGPDSSRAIGCAGLVPGEHGGELVYWIAPEYCGQGYATEAVRAVLSVAKTLGHREITALDRPDNAASGRVLAKLGFRATGDTSLRVCRASGILIAPQVHSCDLRSGNVGLGNEAARYAA